MALFSWWYGTGWKQVIQSFNHRIYSVAEAFSISQLLRTMFAPWKRITTDPGRSLEARFRAAADNAFSRMIGFVVRIIVIFAALFIIILVAVGTIIEIVVWPLLPIAVPGSIIAGLAL